jgi:RHS repeat-associated protein
VQNTDGSGNDYGYDSNANVITSSPKSINTITYDTFTQRPTSVSMNSGASLTLEYGGDTQRVLKNYNNGSNTNSRLYLHGDNDYPLIEKNRVSVTAETLAVYIYGLNGAVAKRMGSTVLFLLKDHLGSNRVVMDATGLVRTYYDYDALGNIIRIGTTNEVKYQFTGQEYDESGVHNYRARLYDSDLGKFYAVDPAGQGWSAFAYAGNNPVIIVDADGKVAWFVPILIGAGVSLLSNTEHLDAGEWYKNPLKTLGFAGVGALGGALSLVGGGGAWYGLQDVLLGAIEGGLTGGLNNLVAGEDFLKGFKSGAIVGAAFGLVSSEQFQNTLKGHGWRSNQQVIKNFYEAGAYQEAIDYAVDVYDIDILEGKAKWDPTLPAAERGRNAYVPGPLGAKWEGVRIGAEAFTGGIYPSQLQGTLFHEARHAQHLLKGELGRVVQQASTGEGLAYGATLRNAGLLHLSKDVRAYYAMRFYQEAGRHFQNRFWYNIPLRNFWF